MPKYITQSAKETQKMGEILARELLREASKNAKVICLSGDLGSGKTTFTQGILKGLKVEGPYTSPTFVILKEYGIRNTEYEIRKVYHIDAYRVGADDILNLGWKEILSQNNIAIVEWAERIKTIIPADAIWINFRWIDRDKRELVL